MCQEGAELTLGSCNSITVVTSIFLHTVLNSFVIMNLSISIYYSHKIIFSN